MSDPISDFPLASGKFNQGAAAVRKMEENTDFNNHTRWEYSEAVTSLYTNFEGGQLIDKTNPSYCLGYSEVGNFDENGIPSTRIQVVPCITIGTATDEEMKKQTWSIEMVPTAMDMVYIRNICSDQLIKKVKSCEDKHKLSYDEECKNFHFELELVERDQCIDGYKFGVDDCAWFYDVTP
jgi:hypothetical protein